MCVCRWVGWCLEGGRDESGVFCVGKDRDDDDNITLQDTINIDISHKAY